MGIGQVMKRTPGFLCRLHHALLEKIKSVTITSQLPYASPIKYHAFYHNPSPPLPKKPTFERGSNLFQYIIFTTQPQNPIVFQFSFALSFPVDHPTVLQLSASHDEFAMLKLFFLIYDPLSSLTRDRLEDENLTTGCFFGSTLMNIIQKGMREAKQAERIGIMMYLQQRPCRTP